MTLILPSFRSIPRVAVLALAGLASACVGSIGDAPADQTPTSPLPEFAPAPGRLRRLTAEQYTNSIRDVFGPEVTVPRGYVSGDTAEGLLSVGVGITSVGGAAVTQLEAAALAIGAQAAAEGPIRDRLVGCTPSGIADDVCAAAVLGPVGARAYRRPLQQVELDSLIAVAREAAEARGDFHAGLGYAYAVLLQAPSFLYRVELGRTTAEDPTPGRYDGAELATRLAFFFWNTTPDESLLAAASDGTLETDEGLRAAVARLSADPRIRTGVRAFFADMLQLARLDALTKDPNVYVHFNSSLGSSAREETLRGIEHLVVDARGDYRDLFTTRTSFVDRRLAAIYDVPAPTLEGFGMLRYPEDSPRAGLLGQVAFLALNAHAASSSATLRGKYVRNVFLCAAIPPPPANLNTAIPDASEANPTLRDRVREHLSVPSCKSCHLLMDPIGLGFENFDGIGRYRTIENGARIDATGVFDQSFYADARGLGRILRDHPDVPACLVRTMYRYATGHVEITSESAAIRALEESFVASGHDVLDLMRAVATSPGFLESSEPTEGP